MITYRMGVLFNIYETDMPLGMQLSKKCFII